MSVKKSMRVLFVCSGNAGMFDIVPFIKEQGESLKNLGVTVDYYPIRGKGLWGYLRAGLRLRDYLKIHQYDLIHAHFTLSGYAALIGARNIPVVLSLMGSDAYGEYIGENKVQFSSRLLTILTYLIQPFVSAIISKSVNIDKYVYLTKKSFIIPNGIDIGKFRTAEHDYRDELGMDREKRQVLFLGSRKSVRKNIQLAEQAIRRIQMQNVVLVNPHPVAHEAVPKYLNSTDVLAVCSYMEGSPNLVKEAMACNCPIVATDVGDVSWVLGRTDGCYIASFDPEDYAKKLMAALKFSEAKGRTNGESRIRDLGLDSESVAKRVIEVYKYALHY